MNEILKKLRSLHNYSQSYVAEYLNVSRQMYIKYESGEVEPSVKVVKELCKLYKVEYSAILGELEFVLEKSKAEYNNYSWKNAREWFVTSPAAYYGVKNPYSALQLQAVNQIKQLSDFQVMSVLAYIKLLNEEMAENLKNKYKKSMANPVDPVEVERINAVYDKISKEEQLRFAKVGSKTVCEALKNDTW